VSRLAPGPRAPATGSSKGKWLSEETYSNLCALCERPEVCDYPDAYSGYDGALRCLTHNGGDVAWTKATYVRQYFGLDAQGSNEATATPATPGKADPGNYRYLCPDGTKVTIDEKTKPCTWAARPWQGYMTNGGVADIDAVQKVAHPHPLVRSIPTLLLRVPPPPSRPQPLAPTPHNWQLELNRLYFNDATTSPRS
jgi:hypothetical protein